PSLMHRPLYPVPMLVSIISHLILLTASFLFCHICPQNSPTLEKGRFNPLNTKLTVQDYSCVNLNREQATMYSDWANHSTHTSSNQLCKAIWQIANRSTHLDKPDTCIYT